MNNNFIYYPAQLFSDIQLNNGRRVSLLERVVKLLRIHLQLDKKEMGIRYLNFREKVATKELLQKFIDYYNKIQNAC